MLNLHKAGVDVTILVSKHIYGEVDSQLAQQCYSKLFAEGMTIHTAWYFSLYMYNHVRRAEHCAWERKQREGKEETKRGIEAPFSKTKARHSLPE